MGRDVRVCIHAHSPLLNEQLGSKQMFEFLYNIATYYNTYATINYLYVANVSSEIIIIF